MKQQQATPRGYSSFLLLLLFTDESLAAVIAFRKEARNADYESPIRVIAASWDLESRLPAKTQSSSSNEQRGRIRYGGYRDS